MVGLELCHPHPEPRCHLEEEEAEEAMANGTALRSHEELQPLPVHCMEGNLTNKQNDEVNRQTAGFLLPFLSLS